MLTAIEENNPMVALNPVSAEKAVFIYVLVICVLPVTNGPPSFVTIAAHRNRVRNVGGTMTAFTRNRMRSF